MASVPDLDAVLRMLLTHEDELKRRGVTHASIFGSVARGDATSASDVDILVTLDPERPMDAFAYAGLIGDLSDWLGRPVDVALRDRLKPDLRDEALASEVHAF
jgi:predicted nucleotidyltransferase